MFSAAERESAYVIDGLMHNEVIQSDIHSTDPFGFSALAGVLLHFHLHVVIVSKLREAV